MSKQTVRLSKFLSYVLRHRPDAIGLTLDSEGWASVTELIDCAAKDGKQLTPALIEQIVRESDKQRFALSEDKQRVRANQGHSIKIDLGLVPLTPPARLYHGTATRFLGSIQAQGLLPQRRHHVHLSADLETAKKVGVRHGKLAILVVDTAKMHADGLLFYQSENGVWLTDKVPPAYFEMLAEG